MIYDGDCLMRLLRATRRRRRVMLVLRGIALVLGSSGASLLLAGWAAYRYRHDEGALLILRAATAFAVVASVYLLLIRPLLKRISNAQLARLIEERHPSVNDRFVAAVEFSALDQPQRISPAIINRLVADADQLAATIHPRTVIARRRLWAYGAAAVICILFFCGDAAVVGRHAV